MPITIKPRKLSARGIFANLLPQYLMKPKHPQQSLPDEARSVKVPWDANELFDRIKSKKEKFRDGLQRVYEANAKVSSRVRDTTWCVATGSFVPRNQILATHLFPAALGSNIMRFVGGVAEIWSPANGLLLPKHASHALTDWALMVVPSDAKEKFSLRHSNYKFSVLDAKYPTLSQELYQASAKNGLPKITTEELNEKQLIFCNEHRPKAIYFYFLSCCAIWKTTYLENPDCDDVADFTDRFISNMSQYWHPEYVKQSKITNFFTFKLVDSEYHPPDKFKTNQLCFHPSIYAKNHNAQEGGKVPREYQYGDFPWSV